METTTQIRAVPAGPGPGRVDSEGATQLIPPVPADGGGDPEATAKLRVVTAPAPGPRPGQGMRHAQRAQNAQSAQNDQNMQATQAMPTVPDDFDNLFRTAASHTPQDPRQPPPSRGTAGRRRSPALVIAAVVIGCAVLGLGAGAALSGGGDGGEEPAPENSASAPEGEEEPGPEAAPPDGEGAAEQAEALSALLDDSNDSRDSVIQAVADIKGCDRLPQAAADLRAAAEQRNGLVTRLEELAVDQIPDGAALSTALTEAWRASAEADEHYAVWADEARTNPQVCRGGQAAHTERASQGDAASGRATEAKERAAGLWNPVAGEHGLPERAATQL
ncbi:hypothetical protein [Streptomyces sp. SBT349]|uniref:hypothetical protein n=1 Tax=Streptomyces sp. SBT349 TaxID=1580539 RepID=UPI00069D698E|nr:hypothetical protein [Streptomyces sp. SBT349]